MLITTWIDVLDPAELEKIMERERRMRRRRTVDDGRADVVLATHARRERIVNEMLELSKPSQAFMHPPCRLSEIDPVSLVSARLSGRPGPRLTSPISSS